MVKIKVKYIIKKEKELELNTRQWCEFHVDKTKLVKQLAKENNVDEDCIVISDGYCDIIEGELDFKSGNEIDIIID